MYCYLAVLSLKYCAVCDVTFIALEQYIKANEKQEKQDITVKKDKMPKEERPKTPTQTIKKISKIPPTKQGNEKIVLKPVETPEKSKVTPMKKKQITSAAKKIEVVTPKPVGLEAKSEHKDPEILTKANRIPTEKNEMEKCSYTPSNDEERSKIDEKPGKEDKVKIQAKKTEKSPKDEAKPLIIKKGRHILKECEEKVVISLKPFEHIKKVSEHEKISPNVEKPEEEKPSLTIVTKVKESLKEECETSVLQKSGSLPGKNMEEEKISLKPVELVKKGAELRRTLSPKAEPVPLQRKSSAIVPKKDSPKDLVEPVTLKKVPITSQQKKASQEHNEKAKKPLMKELSPGAVQLEKIPTQQEEVLEEEFEDKKEEQEEEEETWGWEVVPSESYEAEEFDTTLEDGAIEAPGSTDDKIGERETKTSPLVFYY